MATSTSRDPILGVNLAGIYNSTDAEYSRVPLGTIARGADGHDYMYVEASAGIATGDSTPVVVIVTEPGMTVATGAGTHSHKGVAVTTGQRFWVQKTLI